MISRWRPGIVRRRNGFIPLVMHEDTNVVAVFTGVYPTSSETAMAIAVCIIEEHPLDANAHPAYSEGDRMNDVSIFKGVKVGGSM
jgi:hypothetical protein